MKEKPILFSAAMVQANLAGRKCQTRRLVKPVRGFEHCTEVSVDPLYTAGSGSVWRHGKSTDRVGVMQKCAYQPGDILWVRESLVLIDGCWCYRADGAPINNDLDARAAWARSKSGQHCPSIHMPRWASRSLYPVTGVRAERLQAISEEDALAEGVQGTTAWQAVTPNELVASPDLSDDEHEASLWRQYPIRAYEHLWDSIHGAGSWESNPWVWVIEYDNPQRRINQALKTLDAAWRSK